MSKTFAAAKSLFNSTERKHAEAVAAVALEGFPENETFESAVEKRKALSGMVGGQAREQTVLTPDWLLNAIREVAPIGLDPCTTAENPVGAMSWITEEQNALDLPWFQHRGCLTYVNPPYADLKTWMRRCWDETCFGASKVYLLAPFRPQRRWFNEYTKGYTVVTLAPFPFVGHKSAFPAPLCLVCYNLPVPNLGKYETGRWVQV